MYFYKYNLIYIRWWTVLNCWSKGTPTSALWPVYADPQKTTTPAENRSRSVCMLDSSPVSISMGWRNSKHSTVAEGKIIMDGMNPKMRRNKAVHKMMQLVRGIYHDDKQVTSLLVKKRYSEYPRVEVTVERDRGL